MQQKLYDTRPVMKNQFKMSILKNQIRTYANTHSIKQMQITP